MIPLKLMQFWDTSTVPDDIQPLLLSWQKLNLEFEYTLFNREQAETFLVENFNDDVVMAFKMSRFPAMASDIFRIAWCYVEGGVYINAATRCLKPIQSWITPETPLVLMRKWHGAVWNGFIATEPKSAHLKVILDKIIENVHSQNSEDIWSTTGPGVLKEHLPKDAHDIKIIPQIDLKENFQLIGDLSHKKNNHWSEAQKKETIYIQNSEKLTKS